MLSFHILPFSPLPFSTIYCQESYSLFGLLLMASSNCLCFYSHFLIVPIIFLNKKNDLTSFPDEMFSHDYDLTFQAMYSCLAWNTKPKGI